MNVEKFDLLFLYGGDRFIGKNICKITDSEFSHVAIILDKMHVVETDWKKPFGIRHLEYPVTNFEIYRYNGYIDSEQRLLMENFILNNLNKKYDIIQTITTGLSILLGIPIKDTKNKLNCGESVDKMFLSAGINLLPEKEDGFATPGELTKSLLLNNITKQIFKREE